MLQLWKYYLKDYSTLYNEHKEMLKIELNTVGSYNAANEHQLVQYIAVMIGEVLPHLL